MSAPDEESEDQAVRADIAEATRRNGLDFRHVPLISGKVKDNNLANFTAAMSEFKGPVTDRLRRSDFFDHLTGEVFLSQYDAMRALDPESTEKALSASIAPLKVISSDGERSNA